MGEPSISSAGTPLNREATLASLAYINVTWEANRGSYLDNFLPFVLEVLRLAGRPLELIEVRGAIQSRFGLDFPLHVIKSMVDRGVRRAKVTRVERSTEVRLAHGVVDSLPNIFAHQSEYRRHQNRVVDALQAYARDQFNLTWTTDLTEDALVEYIEQNALPLLSSSIRGASYVDAEDPLQGHGYVVAAFVAHVFERRPELFEYLEQMIQGSMLASVLYIESSGEISRRFRNTVLYLDAPFCLRVLGHEGEVVREASATLLALARSQGAELACFEHSLKEIRGILQGARSALARSPGAESGVRGVARHYRQSGGTVSDLDLAIATLERDLSACRIEVHGAPKHTAALNVDESQLEDVLQRVVGYRDLSTLRVDLDSLSAIHRLRGGRSSSHLETCRAVLVTNNYRLVRASRTFFDSGHHNWPLAMLDNTITTLLWVKEPTAAPDLPRRQIIADCFSALAPSASLWHKFVAEVDRLEKRGSIDEESVALLRYSHEAQRAVMDVTYGDPRNLSETTIRDALDRARRTAAAPALASRDHALEQLEQVERDEVQARFDAESSEAEVRALTARVEALETSVGEAQSAIRRKIMKRARIATIGAKLLTALVLLASIVVGIGSSFPNIFEWFPGGNSVGLRVGSAVAFVLAAGTLWRGESVTGWIDHWRDAAIRRALNRSGLESKT